jgi:hypothetical protein
LWCLTRNSLLVIFVSGVGTVTGSIVPNVRDDERLGTVAALQIITDGFRVLSAFLSRIVIDPAAVLSYLSNEPDHRTSSSVPVCVVGAVASSARPT